MLPRVASSHPKTDHDRNETRPLLPTLASDYSNERQRTSAVPRRRSGRCCKGLLCLLLVVVLLEHYFHLPSTLLGFQGCPPPQDGPPKPPMDPFSDVQIDECITDWLPRVPSLNDMPRPWRHNARVSLDVSSGISFVATGSHAFGGLEVTQAADGKEGFEDGKAVVDIFVQPSRTWGDRTFPEDARVCKYTRLSDGGHGLGIYPGNTPDTMYLVRVTLPPRHADGRPLVIPSFLTQLPGFWQLIKPLGDGVYFNDFTIFGKGVFPTVKSVNASNINIVAQNSGIDGTFTANSSIRLLTTETSVYQTRLILHNQNPRIPTRAYLDLSDAIHYNVTATLSSGTENSGGNFDIFTRTTRSNMSLAIPDAEAPIGHTLDFFTIACRSTLRFRLPLTFEGKLDLKSYPWIPKIGWRATPPWEDPTGRARRRFLETRWKWLGIGGKTWWGSENASGALPSAVHTEAYFSDVTLQL